MAKNLEALERLQEIDLRLDRLRHFIDHYQDFIQELEEQKDLIKKRNETEKSFLDELKKARMKKELDLKQGEEHISKCNARLYAVKTNKEYEATLKEIEEQRKKSSDLETEILLLYDQIDQAEIGFKEAKKQSEQEGIETEDKKKELAKKLERAQAILPDEEKAREGILSLVPKDFLENYYFLQQRLGARAFARVIDKVCQTCFRIIPSQMYNEVLVGEKMLTCPGCNRILTHREKEFLTEDEDFEF